ncbi:MAG: FKBP-type peptidyl-prolyl cis-trans isomerase [Saprospiraceae bacterium]
MQKFLFAAVLLTALLYSCEQSGPGEYTTKLGTEYTLHTAGTATKPAVGEYVYFHAYMRNGDSIMFNTRDGGQTPVIQAGADSLTKDQIGPVEDVIRYLGVGDSATVAIRIDTFPSKPPGFEDADYIYYDIAIEEIVDEDTYNTRKGEEAAKAQAEMDAVITRAPAVLAFAEETRQAYEAGSLEGIQTTASGLKYVIHEEGSGPAATPGNPVDVQYLGMLLDGTVFDQSFERGRSINFPLGQGRVIPGWDEGIALLKEGAKASFFIPSELAYGPDGTPDGSIPADSELMFYVELEKAY